MKLLHLLPIATCALVSIVHAAGVEAPFIDDLDAARKQAKAEHKDILVDFTGSDWCGWCITLDKEVFHTAEYKAGAPLHFVSVQLDFPQQTKLPEDVAARNKQWKSELKSMSFPDVLLLDENGKIYAKTGYRKGGSKIYLEHMESLRERRIQRDAALALAEKADGVEKAKHLDAALSALQDDDVIDTYYNDTLKQILALDPSDQAGLQTKFNAFSKRQKCKHEINMLCTGDPAVMFGKLKEYAAKSDIPAVSKQYALYMAAVIRVDEKIRDNDQALELLKQAVATAPASPFVEESLKDAITRAEERITRGKFQKQSSEANAMFTTAYTLEMEKRYDEALEKTVEFASKLSGAERLKMQGRHWRILVAKGPVDTALARLKQIAEEESANPDLQRALGKFLLEEQALNGNEAAATLANECAKRITAQPKAAQVSGEKPSAP